jgi:hypothetical protein
MKNFVGGIKIYLELASRKRALRGIFGKSQNIFQILRYEYISDDLDSGLCFGLFLCLGVGNEAEKSEPVHLG